MLLLGAVCVILVLILAHSMPHGPPPREADGSIAITTMYRYDQSAWKMFPIIGLGLAAPVFLAIGFWRLLRSGKDKDAHTTPA